MFFEFASLYKWMLPETKTSNNSGKWYTRVMSKSIRNPDAPKCPVVNISQAKVGKFNSVKDYWKAVGGENRREYLRLREISKRGR